MSAQDAARRLMPSVSDPDGHDDYHTDIYIVAQAVLDQQRVLGQLAAALERVRGLQLDKWGHYNKELSDAILDAALALPDVAEALAAWRKEQGQ